MLGPAKEWQIQDCVDVHKLLETVFGDQDVANSKFQNCLACIVSHATLFCWKLGSFSPFLLLLC